MIRNPRPAAHVLVLETDSAAHAMLLGELSGSIRQARRLMWIGVAVGIPAIAIAGYPVLLDAWSYGYFPVIGTLLALVVGIGLLVRFQNREAYRTGRSGLWAIWDGHIAVDAAGVVSFVSGYAAITAEGLVVRRMWSETSGGVRFPFPRKRRIRVAVEHLFAWDQVSQIQLTPTLRGRKKRWGSVLISGEDFRVGLRRKVGEDFVTALEAVGTRRS